VTAARTEKELPSAALNYLREIEARTGVEVALVSVGAERDATIHLRDPWDGC
jgi:adenylosuccinate synthase